MRTHHQRPLLPSVCVVAPASAGPGVTYLAHEEAKSLADHYAVTTLFLHEAADESGNEAPPEALAALASAPDERPIVCSLGGAVAALRRMRPDVVVVHLTPGASRWVYRSLAAVAGGAGRRVVLHLHDDGSLPEGDASFDRFADRVVAPALVLAATPSTQAWAVRRFGLTRHSVVLVDGFAPVEGMAPRRRTVARTATCEVVAFLSDVDRRALHDLITAFDGIAEARSDRFRLTLLIRPTSEALTRDLIAGCHHADRIEVRTDNLTDDELHDWLLTADVVVLPDPPATSRALQSAMAHGVPLVVPATERQPAEVGGYPGIIAAELANPAGLLAAIEQAACRRGTHHPTKAEWARAIDLVAGVIGRVAKEAS